MASLSHAMFPKHSDAICPTNYSFCLTRPRASAKFRCGTGGSRGFPQRYWPWHISQSWISRTTTSQVAVCCSVLQRVAVCCSVLPCVAGCCSNHLTGCSVLQRVTVCCRVLQRVTVCCRVLQRVVTTITGGCVLQRVAVCCSVLQCVAACCIGHNVYPRSGSHAHTPQSCSKLCGPRSTCCERCADSF